MDLSKLKEPFPADKISWRVGSTNGDKTKGMALAYIDARDVQDRLDQVCGVENWQCRYPHANGKTVCEIGIRIGDEWIWKADGAGDTDVEAEKGALSDAFKRSAVRWGIGRYLYDMDSPWLPIEGSGKSYRFTQESLAKLRGTKTPPQTGFDKPQNGTAKPSSIAADINKSVEELTAWARKSYTAIQKMSGDELKKFSDENFQKIVELKGANEKAHVALIQAMQDRDLVTNPMGAG